MKRISFFAALLLLTFPRIEPKVFDRCELAKELLDRHEIPKKQLPTWICIVEHESQYNASAYNAASGDHGLFQISDSYWCSPPGSGFACGLPCSSFVDDDIEDDVVCARRIFRAHQRMSGNGFGAWVAYHHWCRWDVQKYVKGCFDDVKVKADMDGDDIKDDDGVDGVSTTKIVESTSMGNDMISVKEKLVDSKKS